jgi:hypothetical protein
VITRGKICLLMMEVATIGLTTCFGVVSIVSVSDNGVTG